MHSDRLRREFWRLALPMMLSNLSVPLLGMVDTAVVGHLEHPYYLGGVALGGTIFSFLYWGFGFLRMGTTGITAQALGKDDGLQVNATLGRALLLALLLAGILILSRKLVSELAFALLQGSPAAEAQARRYVAIRIFSAPATLINYACIGWFIGLQNTRLPLALMLLANLCNIVLDFWFVWVWHWQVAGVALASVLAEYLGTAVALPLAWRRWRQRPTPAWRQIVQWREWRRLIAVNLHLFVRTLLLLFAFAFFTAQSARLGDVILAANTILLNLQSFMAYVLDSFAHAAEALAGRAKGDGNRILLRRTVRLAAVFSLGFAALFSLTYAVGGHRLIALLTDQEPVRRMAVQFLLWAVILPLISAWSFVLDGVFIGLTRAREMRNVMAVSVLLVYLPAWWWSRPWGNTGLWFAFCAFMAVRSLGMELCRRRLGI
ncbi:multidrug resistance protein, MATE family [Methylomarinovum caldicuralii]|uniref:Multidrug resistance protein, MATE family n=1 Tax=Methylomarinovum caldicuralii TaxID=438856 RepID=A0AAU9C7N8_9GAMM|nr:MATE family efflux transporter [Methylomarinovum caldicuralii]BCX82064.1 multidrug resistance protein, MATE family [Methylomarinovum caldicuralii]